MNKLFDLSDVISISTGRLVSNRGMEGIYDIMGHIVRDPHITTVGLSQMFPVAKEEILNQYPQLKDISEKELDDKFEFHESREEAIHVWVDSLRPKYGNALEVAQMDHEPDRMSDIEYVMKLRQGR